MQENQQGNVETNPSKINRPGQGGAPAFNPAKPAEKDEAGFDSETDRNEINPGKLDYEKDDDDWTGTDHSQGHEPYEFKNRPDADRSLRKGHGESNFAIGSGAEGDGQRETNEGSRGASLKKGVLVGQTHAGLNGFGTSGTSGTSSGGNQGYQSGLGSAGSQNGSTGYNAGSQGMPEKIQPHRPNKEVDINKLGRKIEETDETKETRH